jgi:dTDP-4-dehydrorhamnose 3,5-epimerase-like enzyme
MKVKIHKLEIHSDSRGWLAEIIRRDEIDKTIAQVYVSQSIPGIIRGGHYHKKKTEWFFVIKGNAKLTLKDLLSNEERVIYIKESDHILVEIPPMVFHKIESQTELYLLVISSEVFNRNEPDTYSD